jgi:hypothetical protein
MAMSRAAWARTVWAWVSEVYPVARMRSCVPSGRFGRGRLKDQVPWRGFQVTRPGFVGGSIRREDRVHGSEVPLLPGVAPACGAHGR